MLVQHMQKYFIRIPFLPERSNKSILGYSRMRSHESDNGKRCENSGSSIWLDQEGILHVVVKPIQEFTVD